MVISTKKLKKYLFVAQIYKIIDILFRMQYDKDMINQAFYGTAKDEILLIHINIEGLCVFRFVKKYNIDELGYVIQLIDNLMKQKNNTKYLSNIKLYKSYFASVINTCYDFMLENNRSAQNFVLNEPVGFIIIQKLTSDTEKNISNFNFHVKFATSSRITQEQIKESLDRNGPDLIEICDMTIDDMLKQKLVSD